MIAVSREQAVIRTVGTTQDPVRYMSVNRFPVPPTAHARQARATHTATCRRQLSPVFSQLRAHLNRLSQRRRIVGSGPRIAHRAQPTVC